VWFWSFTQSAAQERGATRVDELRAFDHEQGQQFGELGSGVDREAETLVVCVKADGHGALCDPEREAWVGF
jgi:hypothetical protein